MRSDKSTWDVDRYPVCGHRGGRYVRGNIVVSCPSCNRSRCHSCEETVTTPCDLVNDETATLCSLVSERTVRVGSCAAAPF